MAGSKIIEFALAAFVFIANNALAAGAKEPDFTKLEDRLGRLRDRWSVPGMVAGVARCNQVVWTKGFGYADLATKEPVTPDTVFHLASLTKPFAAVVLLQLVEAGQLHFDAPVEGFGVSLKSDGVILARQGLRPLRRSHRVRIFHNLSLPSRSEAMSR